MNDHHFSYPIVVPLREATISGHATQSPTPTGPVYAAALGRQDASAVPAPRASS